MARDEGETWTVEHRADHYAIIENAETDSRCEVAECWADVVAHLIAAAPALLAATKALLDAHCAENCNLVVDEHTAECLQATKAIAQAEARS